MSGSRAEMSWARRHSRRLADMLWHTAPASCSAEPHFLLCHSLATPSPLLRSASFARVSAPHTARHVLVSYPLGVLWALATLRAGKCREEVKRLAGDGSPLLLVHGTADQFTSAAVSAPSLCASRP